MRNSRLGRTQGRTMLKKLQQETGLEPRDLEKERRDIEKGKKELRRWMKKKSEHPTKEPSGWPARYILKRMWVAYMPVSHVGPLTLISRSSRIRRNRSTRLRRRSTLNSFFSLQNT